MAAIPATLARPAVARRRLPVAATVAAQALGVWTATRLLDVALTILFTSGSAAQRLGHWWFWDAPFYLGTARFGYLPNSPQQAAFFPLYPLLVHPFLGADPLEQQIAALAVANLGTLAALALVGLLAAHEARDPRAAWAPMLLLAASPLAVFLAGAYTDGLFIALVAWALLAARRRAWAWAAAAAALAIVTRPFGVLLVPALAVEYASQHAWWWRLRTRAFARPRRATVRQVALLLLAPAGALGAFLAVLWRQYGDPLATLRSEVATPEHVRWGHGLRWPWQTLGLVWRQLALSPHWSWETAHLLLDLAPPLLCLAVALLAARGRAPGAYALLTLGVALTCLCAPMVVPNFPDPLASDGRYCYAAVPVLLQGAAWMRRWPRRCAAALLGVSLALQCVLTVFVLRGGWLV